MDKLIRNDKGQFVSGSWKGKKRSPESVSKSAAKRKGTKRPGVTGSNNLNWKGGKSIVCCENCGKELLRYPLRITRGNSFCNLKCKHEWQKGKFVGADSPSWKGGRIVSKEGYIEIHLSTHHRAKQNGFVFEHILVAEKKYGREIMRGEHIHHLNGIKDDNRPENLVVLTNSKHDKFSRIHGLQERIRELENQLAEKFLHG
jgi:hypothetical protein